MLSKRALLLKTVVKHGRLVKGKGWRPPVSRANAGFSSLSRAQTVNNIPVGRIGSKPWGTDEWSGSKLLSQAMSKNKGSMQIKPFRYVPARQMSTSFMTVESKVWPPPVLSTRKFHGRSASSYIRHSHDPSEHEEIEHSEMADVVEKARERMDRKAANMGIDETDVVENTKHHLHEAAVKPGEEAVVLEPTVTSPVPEVFSAHEQKWSEQVKQGAETLRDGASGTNQAKATSSWQPASYKVSEAGATATGSMSSGTQKLKHNVSDTMRHAEFRHEPRNHGAVDEPHKMSDVARDIDESARSQTGSVWEKTEENLSNAAQSAKETSIGRSSFSQTNDNLANAANSAKETHIGGPTFSNSDPLKNPNMGWSASEPMQMNSNNVNNRSSSTLSDAIGGTTASQPIRSNIGPTDQSHSNIGGSTWSKSDPVNSTIGGSTSTHKFEDAYQGTKNKGAKHPDSNNRIDDSYTKLASEDMGSDGGQRMGDEPIYAPQGAKHTLSTGGYEATKQETPDKFMSNASSTDTMKKNATSYQSSERPTESWSDTMSEQDRQRDAETWRGMDKMEESEDSVWDRAKDKLTDAAMIAKETLADAGSFVWSKTKDVASDAAQVTANKSQELWHATKDNMGLAGDKRHFSSFATPAVDFRKVKNDLEELQRKQQGDGKQGKGAWNMLDKAKEKLEEAKEATMEMWDKAKDNVKGSVNKVKEFDRNVKVKDDE